MAPAAQAVWDVVEEHPAAISEQTVVVVPSEPTNEVAISLHKPLETTASLPPTAPTQSLNFLPAASTPAQGANAVPPGMGSYPQGFPPAPQALPRGVVALPRVNSGDARWVAAMTGAFVGITIVMALLTLIAVSLSASDSSSTMRSSAQADSSIIRVFAFLATALWTSHIRVGVSAVGQVDIGAPLLLPAVVAVIAFAAVGFLLSRVWRPAGTSALWVRTGALTLACTLVLCFIGLIGRAITDAGIAGQVTVSALSFGSLLRFACVIGVATALATAATATPGQRLNALLGERLTRRIAPFAPSLAIAGWHVAVWTVLGIVIWPVLWAVKLRDEIPFAAMAGLLPSASSSLAALGTFSGQSFTMQGVGSLPGLGDISNVLAFIPAQGTYSVFHPAVPMTSWLVVLLGAVVVLLLAGRLAGLRSIGSSRSVPGTFDLPSIAVTAAALGALWLPVLWLTGALSIRGSAAGTTLAGRVGVPYWTIFVFALAGVLIEVVATLLGARLLATAPWLARPLLRSPAPAFPAPTFHAPTFHAPTFHPEPLDPSADAPLTPQAHQQPGSRPVHYLPQQQLPQQPLLPQQQPQQRVPAQPARPLSKWWLIGVIGVVALLVLAFVVPALVGAVYARTNGPEALATNFMNALVDGDAEKATELGRPNLSTTERTLLTNAVYQAATRPSSVRVKKVTEDGDTATIDAEYVLDGRTIAWPLTAEMTGKKFGLLPQWELRPVELPRIIVGVNSDALLVEKTKLALSAPSDGSTSRMFSAAVLPGIYTLEAGGAGKFFSSTPVEYLATSETMEGVDDALVALKPTDAFYDEADRQLKAAVDACVKENTQSACPMVSLYSETKITTVNSYPTVDRSQDFAPSLGTITDLPVTAGEVATSQNFFGSAYDSTDSIASYGWKVLPTAEQVTVTFAN